jgi:tetratricopeptide (TPR) repeat protein
MVNAITGNLATDLTKWMACKVGKTPLVRRLEQRLNPEQLHPVTQRLLEEALAEGLSDLQGIDPAAWQPIFAHPENRLQLLGWVLEWQDTPEPDLGEWSLESAPNPDILRGLLHRLHGLIQEKKQKYFSPDFFNLRGNQFAMLEMLEDLRDQRETVLAGINKLLQLAPAASPLSEPPPGTLSPIWNVPFVANPNFTGREALLTALHDALISGQSAALTQTLSGLGGVGKTQLAVEYCYRHRDDYHVIWWVQTEEAATLAADYAALASELGLPEHDASEQEVVVNAVRRWLEQHGEWLLIFDNVTAPGEVQPYLPRAASGHVLITSRSQAWGGLAQRLTVAVFERLESVAFLSQRTQQGDTAAADALAEALGDLPLALAQAASYIESTGTPMAMYLELFETRRADLWAEENPPQDYPDTVGTTWSLAMNQLGKESPEGSAVLKLCSYLGPGAIPREVMTARVDGLPSGLAEAIADPLVLNRALSALQRYGLLEIREDSVSVHRLVQAVTRDRLPTQDRLVWVKAALQMVDAIFPEEVLTEPQTWVKCERLLPHALAATAHEEALDADAKTTACLLNKTGLYFTARAQYRQAQGLVQRSLAIREEVLGPKHPDTAQSLNNLGSLLQAQGDLDGARPYVERALVIREEVLGAEDLETAISLNNLGGLLQAQGDLDGARPYLERALKIYEAVAGAEHPDTAQRLNSLGTLLRAQGDLDGARLYFERALFIRKAFYGAKHPETAQSLNSLGSVLHDRGDLAEARSYFEQALCIFRNSLGETHPWTQTVHRNLDSLDALEAAE